MSRGQKEIKIFWKIREINFKEKENKHLFEMKNIKQLYEFIEINF